MFVSFRPGFRAWVIPLAAAVFFCIPHNAFAQFGNLGNLGGLNLGNLGGNLGQLGGNLGQQGGIAGGGQQAPMIQRAMNPLPNPTNYWQYTQVTGVKPIIGTVRIYNTFGTLGIQSGGGLGQGFNAGQQAGGLGGGGGGAGGNIPGIGATQGGDDPPQGVLLHVQYAQMFFPNQQNINQNAFQGQGGGFGGGGFGGFPGGFGGGFPGGFGGGGKFGGFNGGFGF